MRVKWYGTATLLVETETTKVLLDPYCHEFSEKLPKLPIEEFKDVDAIFISHPHFDHFVDIDRITEVTNAPVYVGKRGLELAEKNGFSMKNMHEMKVGDLFELGNLSVKIHQGKHCVFDHGLILGKLKKSFDKELWKDSFSLWKLNHRFKIGKKDIFTIEFEEHGKKMVFMGSANVDQNAVNPHHMDVLLYPYQGRSDMLDYSIPILDYLQPKKVILDHFDDAFPPLTSDMKVEELVRYADEHQTGYSVMVPGYQEWIEV